MIHEAQFNPAQTNALRSLAAKYPTVQIYLMTFSDAPVNLGPQFITTMLPAGSKAQQAQMRACAEGVGLQLALNEGAQMAVVIALSREIDDLPLLLTEVLRGGADFIIDDDQQHCRFALLSHRAAFMAGLWAQFPLSLGDKRRDCLGHIAAALGARVAVLGERTLRTAAQWQTRLTPAQARIVAQATDLGLRPLPHIKPVPPKSVAVITPYYKEPTAMLRRAHESVLKQGANVRHFFIADGFPSDDVKSWDVTHIALASSHADNGNTPRGIGGIIAFAQGFDAVTYLDADNWYDDGHIKSLLKTQRQTDATAVCALRAVVLPDGTHVSGADPEDLDHSHVDTSCLLLTRERQFLAHFWSQMPQFCGPICDRFAWTILKNRVGNAWTNRQSVFFESNYAKHFIMAGKSVPENVHDLLPDAERRLAQPSREWLELYRRKTARDWAW